MSGNRTTPPVLPRFPRTILERGVVPAFQTGRPGRSEDRRAGRARRATDGGFLCLGGSRSRFWGGNSRQNDDLHWNSARDYRKLDRRMPGRIHPGAVLIAPKRSQRVRSHCGGIGCGRSGMCADGNGDLIVYLSLTLLARAGGAGSIDSIAAMARVASRHQA